MKAIRWYLPFWVLGVVVLLSSCTKVPGSAKLIPENATVVMRLDVRQMAECSGLTDDGQMKSELKKMLKDANFSRSLSEKIEKIMDDPSKVGLDLRDPVFVYFIQSAGPDFANMESLTMEADSLLEKEEMPSEESVVKETEAELEFADNLPVPPSADNVEFGVVGTIYNAKDFADFLNELQKEAGEEPIREKDGLYYLMEDEMTFVFNKDYFYLSHKDYAGKQEDEVLAAFRKQFDDGVEESMYENDFFRTMCKKEGVMQMLFSYKGLSDMPEMRLVEGMFMPKNLKLADLAYLMDVHTEKGETKAQFDILTSSNEWDDWLKKGEDIYGKFKGDLLKYISKEGLALFVNINGAKLFDLMKEMPIFKEVPKDMVAQVAAILKSIDGDVAINWTGMDETGSLPRFSVYMQTKDATIINLLKDLDGAKEGFKEKVPNSYVTTIGGGTKDVINFGWKQQTSYLLMGREGEEFKTTVHPFSDNVLKNRRFYMFFNFDLLNRLAKELGDTQMAVEMKEFTGMFDHIEGHDEGMRKAIFTLKHKEKNKTLFELLYTYATGVISRQQQMGAEMRTDIEKALKEKGV